MIIIALPVGVCLLVSAAAHVTWSRRPQSRHARSWSIAFVLTGAGWASVSVAVWAAGLSGAPGAGAELAWLAAGLTFVHGLRQRARRTDRAMVLAAIWAAIAFVAAVLSDLGRDGPLAQAGDALLCAIGLILGAVAIGPRRGRTKPIDWTAFLVLGFLAAGHIVLACALLGGPLSGGAIGLAAMVAGLAYVAVGLIAMLLISGDLTLALERLARTDPLTGLWNRRGFDEAAPVLLRRLGRRDPAGHAAVAIADLDAFKSVNDRFGHQVGDDVLRRFAGLVRTILHRGDLLARLGGEEFVLLAIGADARQLGQRLETLRDAMTRNDDDPSTLPVVTASFGVADVADGVSSLRDAMERADRALYQAKRQGRNRTVVDDGRPPILTDPTRMPDRPDR